MKTFLQGVGLGVGFALGSKLISLTLYALTGAIFFLM